MQLLPADEPETREIVQDFIDKENKGDKENKEKLNNSNTGELKEVKEGLSFNHQNKNHHIPYLEDIFSYLKSNEVSFWPWLCSSWSGILFLVFEFLASFLIFLEFFGKILREVAYEFSPCTKSFLNIHMVL